MTPKTPLTPLLDELAGLDARMAAARQRARSLSQSAAEHADAIGRLKEERVTAYSQDDERKANALKKRTTEAADKAVELEERREGADIAARSAQADRDKYVAQNHGALVDERSPIARAAVQSIEDAIAALAEGVRRWTAEQQIQINLLRPVPGRDGREVPELQCRELARDLRRATSDGVPLPVPSPAPVARVAPEHDPDPGESDVMMEVFGG